MFPLSKFGILMYVLGFYSLALPTMTVPLQYDMKTCDVSGHGKVRYVAAGWV